jgi:hypothetical protein
VQTLNALRLKLKSLLDAPFLTVGAGGTEHVIKGEQLAPFFNMELAQVETQLRSLGVDLA